MLRAIGAFPNLISLHISFNFWSNDKNDIATPLLNIEAARDIFHCIRSASTPQTPPLKALKVDTGASMTAGNPCKSRIPLRADESKLQELQGFFVKQSTNSDKYLMGIDVFCPMLDKIERKLRRKGIPATEWMQNEEYSTWSRKANIGPI